MAAFVTPAQIAMGDIHGLTTLEARPNAAVVFWVFRLMVGIGFAMLGIGA